MTKTAPPQPTPHRIDGMPYVRTVAHQMRIRIVLKILAELIPETSGLRLLSIGCATGEIEVMFQAMGFVVFGIDNSPVALEIARQRGVISKCADVTAGLPCPARSFEVVFAGEIIDVVLDPKFLLNEIKRVLKPKGLVILTIPSRQSFSVEGIFLSLRATGFKIEKVESNYVSFGPLTDGKLSRLVAILIPSLGKNIVVSARKI